MRNVVLPLSVGNFVVYRAWREGYAISLAAAPDLIFGDLLETAVAIIALRSCATKLRVGSSSVGF
jgi:hypothetical protein